MIPFKTYILLLFSLFVAILSSCEKLDVPEKALAPEPVESDDTISVTPLEESDTLSIEELAAFVEYYGSTEETAYSVSNVQNLIPPYLDFYGAIGFPDRYVHGYIIGYVTKNNISHTIFSCGNVETNIVIADSPDETDYHNCMPIQLSTGTKNQKEVRAGLNLAVHPENLGKHVVLHGEITKYMGTLGLKKVNNAIIYTE